MAVIAKNGTFSLKHSNDSGSTYVVVPGVKSFDIGAIENEEIDVTDFDSTGNFREFATGYQEASSGSFTINYDPQNAIFLLLRAAQTGGTTEYFQAVYDDETVEFNALVTSISTPVSIGEVMEATITIKLTGQPTYS